MTKEEFEDFKSQDMEDGVLFRAFLRRNREGNIVLYVETDEAIENFFQTENTGESEHWANDEDEFHEYYMKQYSRHDGSEMGMYFNDKNDGFGDSYVNSGKINVGMLRTVGLSDGVEFEIPETYSEETMKESVESLKNIVEEVYKKFIRPVNVMSEIRVQEL